MRTGWSGNIEYPVITVIFSKSELETYYNKYRENFNFTEVAAAIEKYSEIFFVHNTDERKTPAEYFQQLRKKR